MVKTRKFNDICSAIISLVFIIGTQSKIVHAIPPETGEHVANLADAAVKTGEAASLQAETCGHIAGHAANGAGPALPNLPNGQGGIPPVGELGTANLKAPGMPGGPPAPGKPPIYFPLARPETPGARMANTIGFTGALGFICLNAYWGNPVAVFGCTVMLGKWFLQALGVEVYFGPK